MDNLWLGDCLEEMDRIADGSVDMILADVPYQQTACTWDTMIPLEPMWVQFKRVIKPRGAIVMTATQPFTSVLVMSNLEWFKYTLVWDKKFAGNFCTAKYRPMATFEDVLIFCLGKTVYNPQMIKREISIKGGGLTASGSIKQNTLTPLKKVYDRKFPVSILKFPRDLGSSIHPTQKPTALFAYLIKTYTNPGDLVLDPTAGSGTTAIAAIETGRDWLCIEQDPDYYAIAQKRIEERLAQPFLIDPNPRHNGHKAEQVSFA